MLRGALSGLIAALVAACMHVGAADPYIQGEMASRHLPGLTFAVVKDGAVVASGSYGLANVELNSPASGDTVYAIGSITKSMTAIAVMKLVEDGTIHLEDSIRGYASNLPEHWRSITVQHALSNTSGIPDLIDNPCKTPAREEYSLEDAIGEVVCLPLMFEPGEKFSYSNSNYIVLSMILERVTAQRLGDVFRESIFAPLGMNDTRMADYVTVIANRADGYLHTADGLVNVSEMDPAMEAGAGGVISTIGDMTRFVRGLGDPALLAPASWERLWTPPQVRSGQTPYALGFGVTPFEGERRIGHNGAAPGFASSFAWFPDQRVGVILLTNGYEEPHGRSVMSLANEIASRYFD